MHTDMTAVTLQSNKIVSNEVLKTVPLKPSHKKKINEGFGQPSMTGRRSPEKHCCTVFAA